MKKNAYIQTEELRNWAEIDKKLQKGDPDNEFNKDDYVHSVMGTEATVEKQAGALAAFAFILIAVPVIFVIKLILSSG